LRITILKFIDMAPVIQCFLVV